MGIYRLEEIKEMLEIGNLTPSEEDELRDELEVLQQELDEELWLEKRENDRFERMNEPSDFYGDDD